MAELRPIGWPRHIWALPEIQAIDNASEVTISEAEDAVQGLEDDILITTATENGIARREKILGITPLDTDTLEDRRFRVLSKWYDVYPYTDECLEERLTHLCGADGYTMSMDYDAMKLTVRVALGQKSQFNAAKELLEDIVPVYIILDVDLLYNTHRMLSAYTHTQLSTRTHKQLREEELNG